MLIHYVLHKATCCVFTLSCTSQGARHKAHVTRRTSQGARHVKAQAMSNSESAWHKVVEQKSGILAAFMSWLQHESHLAKDDGHVGHEQDFECWVVEIQKNNTLDFIHSDVYTAALHGMMGFEDDELRFDDVRYAVTDWGESAGSNLLSNISIHVSQWGPLVLQEIQRSEVAALFQVIDTKVLNMKEVLLQYPDEFEDHIDKYVTVFKYHTMLQSILRMSTHGFACTAA